jgi:ATP-dependent Clp protease ATP-binding subunit ClpA
VRAGRGELERCDLLETLAQQTAQPVSALADSDRVRLRDLPERLRARIIGQEEPIEKVARTVVYRRQDLGSIERNLGTFLFAGETGVGKTEMARAIAREFFGNKKSLLHLDLAEYNEAGSVNRLLGSPPGYVGSDREGILAEWMHTHASGVLLFDEIEKAHPDIHHLLLGVLDNGRIRPTKGECLDTRQCVIIATTNALTPEDLNRSPLGFVHASTRPNPTDALVRHFAPEFLSRFDELIVFNSLGKEELREILRLRLSEDLDRLGNKGVFLEYDETALLDDLLGELQEERSNARGIARLLERRVMQPLAMVLLGRGEQDSTTVTWDDLC